MTLTYDDILTMTAGRVLASSPAVGWARADGSWDSVRALGRHTVRRLVIVGMMGRELNAAQDDQDRRRRWDRGQHPTRVLRGHPAGPDELAWQVTEAGLLTRAGSSTWQAAECVEWYVGACLAIQDQRHALTLDDRPEPDPLPAWCEDWLARLVCPAKRDYARGLAEALYRGDPAPPVPDGAPWVEQVDAKLARRFTAAMARGEVMS